MPRVFVGEGEGEQIRSFSLLLFLLRAAQARRCELLQITSSPLDAEMLTTTDVAAFVNFFFCMCRTSSARAWRRSRLWLTSVCGGDGHSDSSFELVCMCRLVVATLYTVSCPLLPHLFPVVFFFSSFYCALRISVVLSLYICILCDCVCACLSLSLPLLLPPSLPHRVFPSFYLYVLHVFLLAAGHDVPILRSVPSFHFSYTSLALYVSHPSSSSCPLSPMPHGHSCRLSRHRDANAFLALPSRMGVTGTYRSASASFSRASGG